MTEWTMKSLREAIVKEVLAKLPKFEDHVDIVPSIPDGDPNCLIINFHPKDRIGEDMLRDRGLLEEKAIEKFSFRLDRARSVIIKTP